MRQHDNGMDSYLRNLSAKLYEFQKKGIFCDTVLIANDCKVSAHSVILAAASPRIYTSFSSVAGHKARPCRFSITLAGCTSRSVKAVLQLLYTGSLELPASCWQPEQIKDVALVCERMGLDVAKLDGISVLLDNVHRKFIPAANKESSGKEKDDSSSGLVSEPVLEFDAASYAHLEKGVLEQNRSFSKVETLQKENVEYKGREECSVSELSPTPGKVSRITSRNSLNTRGGTCASDHKVKVNLKIQKANAKRRAANLLQSHAKKIRTITRWSIGKNGNGRKTEVNSCLEKNQSSIVTGCSEHEFACKICSAIFLSTKELNSHENRHAGDRPHVCATCGRTYRYRSSLIQHSQMHLESRPYLCDICGHGFVLAVNLRRHTMSRHSNERPFRCKECGRGFLSDSRLRQHMESHTGNRSHVCYLCGKAFNHRGNLNRHISCHSHEKQHMCDICGKAFHRKSNMEKHVLLHSNCGPGLTRRKDLREYACLRCEKVFHSEKLLSRHELIHLSKPLISCNICSKTFTASQYLQQHKVSHLEKQFTCNICLKMFANEHFLTTHTRKYHTSPERVNKT